MSCNFDIRQYALRDKTAINDHHRVSNIYDVQIIRKVFIYLVINIIQL